MAWERKRYRETNIEKERQRERWIIIFQICLVILYEYQSTKCIYIYVSYWTSSAILRLILIDWSVWGICLSVCLSVCLSSLFFPFIFLLFFSTHINFYRVAACNFFKNWTKQSEGNSVKVNMSWKKEKKDQWKKREERKTDRKTERQTERQIPHTDQSRRMRRNIAEEVQ